MTSINEHYTLVPNSSIINIKNTNNQFMKEVEETSLYNLLKNPKLKYYIGSSLIPFGWNLYSIAGSINIDVSGLYSVIEFTNPDGVLTQSIYQDITEQLEPNKKYTMIFEVETDGKCGFDLQDSGGVIYHSPTNNLEFTPTDETTRYKNYFSFTTSNSVSMMRFSIKNLNPDDTNIIVKKLVLAKGGIEFLEGIEKDFFLEMLKYDSDPSKDPTGDYSWKVTSDGINYNKLIYTDPVDDYYTEVGYEVDVKKSRLALLDTSRTVLKDISTLRNYKLIAVDNTLSIEEVSFNIKLLNPNGIKVRDVSADVSYQLRLNNKQIEMEEIPHDVSILPYILVKDYITGLQHKCKITNGVPTVTVDSISVSNNVLIDTVTGVKHYLTVVNGSFYSVEADPDVAVGSGILIKDNKTNICYRIISVNNSIEVEEVEYSANILLYYPIRDLKNNINYIVQIENQHLVFTEVIDDDECNITAEFANAEAGRRGIQGEKGDKGDTGETGAQGIPGRDAIVDPVIDPNEDFDTFDPIVASCVYQQNGLTIPYGSTWQDVGLACEVVTSSFDTLVDIYGLIHSKTHAGTTITDPPVATTAIGSRMFTTARSTWTVPAGVTQFSIVLVGGGMPGTVDGGGGGGGLIYATVNTTPGTIYTVYTNGIDRRATLHLGNVSSQLSSLMLTASGGYKSVGMPSRGGLAYASTNVSILSYHANNGENGGYSYTDTGVGGAAATYTSNFPTSTIKRIESGGVGEGVSLYGIGGMTSHFGGGGRGASSTQSATLGQGGGARIIWGTGNVYPSPITSLPTPNDTVGETLSTFTQTRLLQNGIPINTFPCDDWMYTLSNTESYVYESLRKHRIQFPGIHVFSLQCNNTINMSDYSQSIEERYLGVRSWKENDVMLRNSVTTETDVPQVFINTTTYNDIVTLACDSSHPWPLVEVSATFRLLAYSTSASYTSAGYARIVRSDGKIIVPETLIATSSYDSGQQTQRDATGIVMSNDEFTISGIDTHRPISTYTYTLSVRGGFTTTNSTVRVNKATMSIIQPTVNNTVTTNLVSPYTLTNPLNNVVKIYDTRYIPIATCNGDSSIDTPPLPTTWSSSQRVSITSPTSITHPAYTVYVGTTSSNSSSPIIIPSGTVCLSTLSMSVINATDIVTLYAKLNATDVANPIIITNPTISVGAVDYSQITYSSTMTPLWISDVMVGTSYITFHTNFNHDIHEHSRLFSSPDYTIDRTNLLVYYLYIYSGSNDDGSVIDTYTTLPTSITKYTYNGYRYAIGVKSAGTIQVKRTMVFV